MAKNSKKNTEAVVEVEAAKRGNKGGPVLIAKTATEIAEITGSYDVGVLVSKKSLLDIKLKNARAEAAATL